MKIDIENFRFVNKPDVPRFKAVTDIIIEDSILVRDIKLISMTGKDDKLFIAMPSKKMSTGEYKDFCHPTVVNCREKIENVVVDYYKTGKYIAGFKEGIEITEIMMKKVELNNNIGAVLSIHLNNKFVIHDITLREKESLEGMRRFELHMPCRKINETVTNVVYITDENLRVEIFNKVIEKYKGM